MKTLILRYIGYSVVMGCIAVGLYILANHLFQSSIKQNYLKEDQAIYSLLSEKLSKIPRSQRQAQINQWKSIYSPPMFIINHQQFRKEYPNVPVPRIHSKDDIYAEQDWFIKTFTGPLSYSTFSKYILPIAHSDELLVVHKINPAATISRDLYWFAMSMILTFQDTPESDWPIKLNQFNKDLQNWTVKLYPYSDYKQVIPLQHQQQFLRRNATVSYNKDIERDTISYYKFEANKKNYILKLEWNRGFFARHQTLIIWFAFIIAITLIIMLWIYPLLKALVKLEIITSKYSKGLFNINITIPKWSSIYTLYQNITEMGSKVESLLQTNKDVTYGLSHELKTPLSRIQFALDSLEDTPQTEEQKQAINSIHSDTEEMAQLIEQIMLYARIERASTHIALTAQDITSWLSQYALSQQKKLALQNVLFTSKTTFSHPIIINYNQQYLEMLLNNLISNAVKYGHGKVNFNVSIKDSTYLTIEIEDNGNGISEEEVEQALTPFSRLKGTQHIPGHGLGLNLVKKITSWHKGSFAISRSQLGGAKMILQLPIQQNDN